MFGGDSRRDAVEKRLADIRVMLQSEAGLTHEDLKWEDVRAYFNRLSDESPRQFEAQRSLYTSMESADLRDTDLSGLDFRGMSLRACDLSECTFDGAQLAGSLLTDADFDESSFQNMDLRNVEMNPGQIKGADFSGATLEGKRFGFGMSCIYHNANLRNATIEQRTAMDMDVSGADLTGARIDVPWRSPEDGSRRDPYNSIKFDDTTKVEGLHLGDVHDTEAAFVKYAISRGAIASFPRQNAASGEWELRSDITGAIICSGSGLREAVEVELVRIRSELSKLSVGAVQVSREMATQLLPGARESAIALLNRFEGANFEGVDLSMLDFSELSLAGARLRNTRLNGANLRHTSLQGAYLEKADLDAVEGEGLVFDLAEITGSTLKGAKLRGAAFIRAEIRETNFDGANLEDANFEEAKMKSVSLQGCKLDGARMVDASEAAAPLPGGPAEPVKPESAASNIPGR